MKRFWIESQFQAERLNNMIVSLFFVNRQLASGRFKGSVTVLVDQTCFRVIFLLLQAMTLSPHVIVRTFKSYDEISAFINIRTNESRPQWLIVAASLYVNNLALFSRIKNRFERFSVI